MPSTLLKGYNTQGCRIQNKEGQELDEQYLQRYRCVQCKFILRLAYQMICGDRICRGCFPSVPFNCPSCDDLIEPSRLQELFTDIACQREIQNFLVACNCGEWKGGLEMWELHQETCPSSPSPPGSTLSKMRPVTAWSLPLPFPTPSGDVNARVDTEQSVEHEPLQVTCEAFPETVPTEDHYLSFESTSCDYCGKDLSSRRELTKHWEDECTECEMTCPLNKLGGCNFKAKRVEMLQHAQDCHTIQAFEKIVELQEQITDVKSQNQQLQVDLKDKNEFIEKLSDRLACVERFIRSGVEIPDFVEADCAQQYPKSRVDTQLTQPTDIVETDCSKTTTRSARAQKQTPQSQFHISLLDTEPSSEVKLPLNLLREEMDTQKSQLMQLSENMQTVQESITRHAIAIDEVRLRQDVIDVKTTNGVFIWKIPDVRRRYRDAVGRKTISLYSPPFYTSPHGYRMCIRAYLNGDGIGKGSHVSVFLVLMRSEHDSLLSWPFKQSVRFTLINQVNSSASISEAFIPDLQSPSFQRPEAEMNVASGFPKFAQQSVLQDETFTKGNIIFIKAKVDLTGLTMQ